MAQVVEIELSFRSKNELKVISFRRTFGSRKE